MPDRNDFYVGVDLGGTKILAAVFSPGLKCLGKSKRRTRGERGAQAVVDRIARCVRDAIEECDLDPRGCRGVGIGAPGAVDTATGTVIFAPNLGWRDLPLRKELEKRLDLPVCVDNDANACTLGVFEKELGGKPRSLVGMFVGTGIGGGIVLNGQPWSGSSHTAGEIGHMVVQVDGPKCGCGRRGCLEAVASRTAMSKRIQGALKNGDESILTELAGDDLSNLKSSHLRKAVQRGDKVAKRVVREASLFLGIGAANLVNVFNPEYLVLGGGVIAALADEMTDAVVASARDYIFPGAERTLKFVVSELGDDAGITGAAVLARNIAA